MAPPQMETSVKALQTHLKDLEVVINTVQERLREWNDREKVIKQMTEFRDIVAKQLKELKQKRPWLKTDYRD